MRVIRAGVAVAMVLSTGGCVLPNKYEGGASVVKRFVQQVNDDACDEKSGFDLDEATWADACRAVVADVDDDFTLVPVPVTEYGDPEEPDGSSWWARYEARMPYVNADGVPSNLVMAFREAGVFDNKFELGSIRAHVDLTLGATVAYDYEAQADAEDVISPDGRAVIEQADDLLADGRCADLEALLAPADRFPGASMDDCPSIVKMYAATPADDLLDASWDASVYSDRDVYHGGEWIYGVERTHGESDASYGSRVVEAIAEINQKLTRRTVNPSITFEAVLYDDQWYLLGIGYLHGVDAVQFQF